MTPSHDLLTQISQTFLRCGYHKLTMVELAKSCGFTRRALYYYFKSKEEAYRATVRHGNAEGIRLGLEAGERIRQDGGSAIEIISQIMNVRYGTTRRIVQSSPHAIELNAVAFMTSRDIMIEFAISFQDDLERLIVSLTGARLLQLTGSLSPKEIAQALADGARGVNQALPPPPLEDLSERYRLMCHAVLFGCVTVPESDTKPKASLS